MFCQSFQVGRRHLVASLLLMHQCTYAGTIGSVQTNHLELYGGAVFFQPQSDNLKYATWVEGAQPYHQSWHYQAINPKYSPGFQVGLNYLLPNSDYSLNMDWIHLHTSDSSSKQASTGTELSTVEFTAPTFEMSPPVFSIKHVNAQVNFGFDSILLNVDKKFEYNSQLSTTFFGGINILRVKQQLTTTFSDCAGSPPTPYSYARLADPLYMMQLTNKSNYLGAGPNAGFNTQYEIKNGFGILGQALGSLTTGTITVSDNFTGISDRLVALGLGQTQQRITAPNSTQVVPGFDGKIGFFYHYYGEKISKITLEAGYRMATYLNAIATVSPQTLVQPGTSIATPEFATGTMAIVSTDARSRPFNYNGPYVTLFAAFA